MFVHRKCLECQFIKVKVELVSIELRNAIKLEENHWKFVLKAIIDIIIMHLTMENRALHGTDKLFSGTAV